MRTKRVHLFYALFVLVVSFFGLAVSTAMLEQPAQPGIELGERRALVELIYGFICIAGSLTVFFPGSCSRVLGVRQSSKEDLRELDARATRVLGLLMFHGHHPVREDGSAIHEFRIGNKNFCASCFGLLTGAVLSLITITAFLFSGWSDGYLASVLYFVGVGGAVLGFIPVILSIGTWARFILGTVFVTGTCLMLIAAEAVTGDLTADLLVILLSVFWLLSRISWSHRS